MKEKEIKLTADQQRAYDTMMSGRNCFITGDAGAGKSYIIDKYIKDMKGRGKNVVITASTGIAAASINGVTFHRAFGYPTVPMVPASSFRMMVKGTLKVADIIIIDEISMLRRDVFDVFCLQLKDVMKEKKKHIQVIIIGDFNQLQPVVQKEERKVLEKYIPNFGSGFCYLSPMWNELNLVNVKLKEIIRQKDQAFVDALNELKKGNPDAVRWFNESITSKWDGETMVLCSTNNEALEINKSHLDKLSSPEVVYKEYVTGKQITANDRHNDETVTLKVGARVMCLVNDKETRYQNGSIGTIVGIDEKAPHDVTVQFDNGNRCVISYYRWEVKEYDAKEDKLITNVVATIEQIPLRLAWAITIHKSQGQTYDKIAIKPDNIWIPGQMYVALSRCTSVAGIQLLSPLVLQRRTPWGSYQRIPLNDPSVQYFYDNLKED